MRTRPPLCKHSEKFNSLAEQLNQHVEHDCMTFLYTGRVTPFNKDVVDAVQASAVRMQAEYLLV